MEEGEGVFYKGDLFGFVVYLAAGAEEGEGELFGDNFLGRAA